LNLQIVAGERERETVLIQFPPFFISVDRIVGSMAVYHSTILYY